MSLGPTIEWQELAMLCGLAAAVAAPLAWVWRDHRESIGALHKRMDELRHELAAYKLEASRIFVGMEALNRIEARLELSESRTMAGFDRLNDRLDRILEGGGGSTAAGPRT